MGAAFKAVWPLDARLRDPETSHRLVWIPLSCDECFPDAVNAVIDLIAPWQMYHAGIDFQMDENGRRLLQKYPQDFLRLLNAAIDPRLQRIPEDLESILMELKAAYPAVVEEVSYRRLLGAWKLRQA